MAEQEIRISAFEPGGFPIELVLRESDTTALLDRSAKAIDWLKAHGYTPASAAPAAAPGQEESNGNGSQICKIHGAKMGRREKNGEVWFSHKAHREDGSEFWCRGE